MKSTKKILLILLLPLIILGCSQGEISEETSNDFNIEITKDLDDITLEKLNAQPTYTLEEISNLIKEDLIAQGFKEIEYPENFSSNLKGKVSAGIVETKQAAPVTMGPYTISSYKQLRQKDQKVILTGHGGLAVGTYICDIYWHRIEVGLPLNAMGYADVPSPVGYNNIDQQQLGITSFTNSGSTYNTFIAYTLSVRVKYTVTGAHIGRTLPTVVPEDLNYTYYYIKF